MRDYRIRALNTSGYRNRKLQKIPTNKAKELDKIMSPGHTFLLTVRRKYEENKKKTGIQVGCCNANNLPYADDTVLIAYRSYDDRSTRRQKKGCALNIKKTETAVS